MEDFDVGDLVRYVGETHPELKHGEVGVVRVQGTAPAYGPMALVWRGDGMQALWVPTRKLDLVEGAQKAGLRAGRSGG